MMKQSITIGHTADGSPVRLDIGKLIESRMLVQANSGGGKSWMLRVLAELIGPHVPIILFDLEGEFHTLREQIDLLIVGRGGEIPAAVATAGALAIKLLESRVSAVIDLYELDHRERRAYVRRFLESMMAAPKNLWSPRVVFIDEAHMLAPEGADSEATDAVNSLMCQGRKRDFCGILATQRLSKLHKDAAAEANNVLIGRTTLDVDQKRAADVLGFDKSARVTLRALPAGVFNAFGPAISVEGVEQFKSADVTTTHGKKARTGAAPQPSAAMKRAAAELSDLAERAKVEVIDMEGARTKIAELTKEIRTLKSTKPVTQSDPAAIERAVHAAVRQAKQETLKALLPFTKPMGVSARTMQKDIETFGGRINSLLSCVSSMDSFLDSLASTNGNLATPLGRVAGAGAVKAASSKPAYKSSVREAGDSSELPKGETSILRALIMYPDGLQRAQLTVLTTYKRSTRDAYIQRLGEKGFCAVRGDRVVVTDAGVSAMPNAERLPTGEALQEHWMRELPEGEAKILKVLIECFPNSVERDTLTDQTGYQRSTRDAYLQRLGAKELVTTERGMARAADTLFNEVPA